jgi:hypothetical protein
MLACALSFETAASEHIIEKRDIPILQSWSGTYPVAMLDRLPEAQRTTRAGYIDDDTTFYAVWEAFNPGQKAPAVDFSEQLVLFARNTVYFNRTRIVRVTLEKGVAEIVAIETLSAMPIEDIVAMSLAVVPREGVHFVLVGDEHVAVANP